MRTTHMLMLALLLLAGPVAAQDLEYSSDGRSMLVHPEEWDGDPLTGEGIIQIRDWSTGWEGWLAIQINSETGQVEVWDPWVSEWTIAGMGPVRYYDGIPCHDHPAQNARFGRVVRASFERGAQGLLGAGWRCLGSGGVPQCVLGTFAAPVWGTILYDTGWYVWTCYRPQQLWY